MNASSTTECRPQNISTAIKRNAQQQHRAKVLYLARCKPVLRKAVIFNQQEWMSRPPIENELGCDQNQHNMHCYIISISATATNCSHHTKPTVMALMTEAR